jgi:hypothetical protein
MTGINTQHLIEKQVPYHIRENNPVFNKFLEYYYEFQTQSKIPDIIQEVRRYNDIDETDEQFLLEFFEEFKYLPANIVADKRLIAKHIYDLYKTKGSENSLKLLFRIVYGEEIDVYYPSEDVLRASDGQWVQNNVVSVELIQGEIKPTSNRLVLDSAYGIFDFIIDSVEAEDTITRVFFNPKKPYFVDANQLVRIYTNDVLDFIGTLVLMPSTIDVIDGGAFWQLGQLIVLPGNTNTICQISRVGSNGSIKKLDIIQYGSISGSEQVYSISPFQFAPSSDYAESYSEQTSIVPPIQSHSINIFDRTLIQEGIVAASSIQEYIIDGYTLPGYITNIIVNQFSGAQEIINNEITVEQWIQSKARVRLKQQFFAKTAGFYEDLRGQLSAASIRLQDNFFYQLFSYVINTSRVLSDIKNVIGLVHPAGMRYFINTNREAIIDVNATTSRILSKEPIFFNTGISFGETMAFHRSLRLNDIIDATTVSVGNSYDSNNSYAMYDPSVDWDQITFGPGGYDLENYDLSEYDVTIDPAVDQYTQEDDSITLRIWQRLSLADVVFPTTVNIVDQYDANNASQLYDESIDWDAITVGGYDLETYDLETYGIVEEFEQYTAEADSITINTI